MFPQGFTDYFVYALCFVEIKKRMSWGILLLCANKLCHIAYSLHGDAAGREQRKLNLKYLTKGLFAKNQLTLYDSQFVEEFKLVSQIVG